jgi:hypothetical protein
MDPISERDIAHTVGQGHLGMCGFLAGYLGYSLKMRTSEIRTIEIRRSQGSSLLSRGIIQ